MFRSQILRKLSFRKFRSLPRDQISFIDKKPAVQANLFELYIFESSPEYIIVHFSEHPLFPNTRIESQPHERSTVPNFKILIDGFKSCPF